jgi:hypothetical protein
MQFKDRAGQMWFCESNADAPVLEEAKRNTQSFDDFSVELATDSEKLMGLQGDSPASLL